MKERSIAEALKEIDDAKWQKRLVSETENQYYLNLNVKDRHNNNVDVQLELRRFHCDRGHLMMKIEGIDDIDSQDNFPRYFFSFKEADNHTRIFLKWRLYKFRVHPHILEVPDDTIKKTHIFESDKINISVSCDNSIWTDCTNIDVYKSIKIKEK